MGHLSAEEDIKKVVHHQSKTDAKESFLFNQELSKEIGNFLCVSFNFQKVLNTPHSTNTNLYYSRKYSTYNCIIYESGTAKSLSYICRETDGNRGSNGNCFYYV